VLRTIYLHGASPSHSVRDDARLAGVMVQAARNGAAGRNRLCGLRGVELEAQPVANTTGKCALYFDALEDR
jgi:hypothetical protein